MQRNAPTESCALPLMGSARHSLALPIVLRTLLALCCLSMLWRVCVKMHVACWRCYVQGRKNGAPSSTPMPTPTPTPRHTTPHRATVRHASPATSHHTICQLSVPLPATAAVVFLPEPGNTVSNNCCQTGETWVGPWRRFSGGL